MHAKSVSPKGVCYVSGKVRHVGRLEVRYTLVREGSRRLAGSRLETQDHHLHFLLSPYAQFPRFILFYFYFYLAMLCGMWDLSSPTRDQTPAACIESAESLNHWTTRQVPQMSF